MRSCASPRPPTRARPGGRVDAQQQRAVGHEAAGAERVELAHRVDPEPAAGALVGERGVHEAVEQHEPARRSSSGRSRSLDELGARGGVERAPRPARRPSSAGSLTSARRRSASSTPPGSRSTTGLVPAQRVRQPGDERALARAVDPLDRDQHGGEPRATARAGSPPTISSRSGAMRARIDLDLLASARRACASAPARWPATRSNVAPGDLESGVGARHVAALVERACRRARPR